MKRSGTGDKAAGRKRRSSYRAWIGWSRAPSTVGWVWRTARPLSTRCPLSWAWSVDLSVSEKLWLIVVRLTHGSPLTVGTSSVLMSHGSPRQSRMSKIFDPMVLLMPIEPCPCAVMMTDETASGTDVPAARKVKPMTVSGKIFRVIYKANMIAEVSLTNIGCQEDHEVWDATDPHHAVDKSQNVAALEASRVGHGAPEKKSDRPTENEEKRIGVGWPRPGIGCAFVAVTDLHRRLADRCRVVIRQLRSDEERRDLWYFSVRVTTNAPSDLLRQRLRLLCHRVALVHDWNESFIIITIVIIDKFVKLLIK